MQLRLDADDTYHQSISRIADTTTKINLVALPPDEESRTQLRTFWDRLKTEFLDLPPVIAPNPGVPATTLQWHVRLSIWCLEEISIDHLGALSATIVRERREVNNSHRRVASSFGTTAAVVCFVFRDIGLTDALRKRLCSLKRQRPGIRLSQVLRACLDTYEGFRQDRSARTRASSVSTIFRRSLSKLCPSCVPKQVQRKKTALDQHREQDSELTDELDGELEPEQDPGEDIDLDTGLHVTADADSDTERPRGDREDFRASTSSVLSRDPQKSADPSFAHISTPVSAQPRPGTPWPSPETHWPPRSPSPGHTPEPLSSPYFPLPEDISQANTPRRPAERVREEQGFQQHQDKSDQQSTGALIVPTGGAGPATITPGSVQPVSSGLSPSVDRTAPSSQPFWVHGGAPKMVQQSSCQQSERHKKRTLSNTQNSPSRPLPVGRMDFEALWHDMKSQPQPVLTIDAVDVLISRLCSFTAGVIGPQLLSDATHGSDTALSRMRTILTRHKAVVIVAGNDRSCRDIQLYYWVSPKLRRMDLLPGGADVMTDGVRDLVANLLGSAERETAVEAVQCVLPTDGIGPGASVVYMATFLVRSKYLPKVIPTDITKRLLDSLFSSRWSVLPSLAGMTDTMTSRELSTLTVTLVQNWARFAALDDVRPPWDKGPGSSLKCIKEEDWRRFRRVGMASVVSCLREQHFAIVDQAIEEQYHFRNLEKQLELCGQVRKLRRTRPPTSSRPSVVACLGRAYDRLSCIDDIDPEEILAALAPSREHISAMWRRATVFLLLLRYAVAGYLDLDPDNAQDDDADGIPYNDLP